MAATIDVKVDGLNDLLNNIKGNKDIILNATAAAMVEVTVDVANHAKENHTFHNQTGNLEASISPGAVVVQDDVITGEVKAGMEYAAAVEFGQKEPYEIKNAFGKKGFTVTHPPNAPKPFLRPAAEANRQNLIDRVKAAAENAQQVVKVK